MKLYLIVLLYSVLLCSCNNESNLKNLLTKQTDYLDLEFEELALNITYNYSISNEYESLQERLINIESIIKNIDKLLDKNSYLTNETLTEINNFYSVCNVTETTFLNIDSAFFDLNKLQLIYWNEIYNQKHKISSLEKINIINNLKLTRNIMLNRMFNDIDSYYFRFRHIMPLILEDTPDIKLGDTYKADVLLAVIKPIKFKHSNEIIEMENGKWKIEIPSTIKGDFEWSGEFHLIQKNGELKIPISKEYTVK